MIRCPGCHYRFRARTIYIATGGGPLQKVSVVQSQSSGSRLLMNITYIDTTEEMVLNPEYEGWRMARIEVFVEGQKYPYEVGRIEVFKDDLLFEAVREKISFSTPASAAPQSSSAA